MSSGAVFFCALVSLGQEPFAMGALGYSALLQQSGEGEVKVDQGIEAAIQALLDKSNSATQKAIREALVITQAAKNVRTNNIQPLMVSDEWTILKSFHYLCQLFNLSLECIDGKIKIDSSDQKVDRVLRSHAILVNRYIHELLTGSVKFDPKAFKEGAYFKQYYEYFKRMNMLLKDANLEEGIIFYESTSEEQRQFTLLIERHINNKLKKFFGEGKMPGR